jgi:hypothetical protein
MVDANVISAVARAIEEHKNKEEIQCQFRNAMK